MVNRVLSYTSACLGLPIKVLHDVDLVKSLVKSKFVPLRHMQLCLTNKCNLKCSYCVCQDSDRSKELKLGQVKSILWEAKRCGCRALTLTGGGEPLVYEDIEEVVRYSGDIGIKVGLVTNGVLLERLPKDVVWCRISFDSFRDFKTIEYGVNKAVNKFSSIVWSFSYVLTKQIGDLKKIVEFANDRNFSHVRVVDDVLNVSEDIMNEAKMYLKGIDEKVIYQSRVNPIRGYKKCLVSILKPTIAADGKIYPCCAIQCAIKKEKHDFPERYNMGDYKDLHKVVKNQRYFDGSVCDICYYSHYNDLLKIMMEDVAHKEWV